MGNSEEKRDLVSEGFRIKQKTILQKQPKEIKCNNKQEINLCKVYKQGPVATFYCKKKAANKWKKEECKSYNI